MRVEALAFSVSLWCDCGPGKALEYCESVGNNRDREIARAYASGGYSVKEIAKHFGLHYSRVSRIVSAEKIRIRIWSCDACYNAMIPDAMIPGAMVLCSLR